MQKQKNNKLGVGVALGISFGTVIGVLTNNLVLWVGLGISIGGVIGTTMSTRDKREHK